MGMFDTIHVEGIDGIDDGEYQTKSLDCQLDVYRLENKKILKRFEVSNNKFSIKNGIITPQSLYTERTEEKLSACINIYDKKEYLIFIKENKLIDLDRKSVV